MDIYIYLYWYLFFVCNILFGHQNSLSPWIVAKSEWSISEHWTTFEITWNFPGFPQLKDLLTSSALLNVDMTFLYAIEG